MTKPSPRPLQTPQTIGEAKALIAWGRAQPKDAGEPISRERLLKKIAFMESTLPSKAIGVQAGKERVTVLVSVLGGFSEEAIAWMVQQACLRLDWFPTPKQCLALIEEHAKSGPPSAATIAITDGRKFLEQRLAEFLDDVKAGDAAAIDRPGISDHWRWIAVERGYLRHNATDGFTIRAQPAA